MMKKIALAAALAVVPAAFGLYSAFASSDTQPSNDYYGAPCYEQSYDNGCYYYDRDNDNRDNDNRDNDYHHHYRHHHYRGCGW